MDPNVLRTLIRHSRLAVAPDSRYPCSGVYAVIEAPGAIRLGNFRQRRLISDARIPK